MKPIRIQRSRQHKQVSPNALPVVYVGRPSKWGNPFTIGMAFIESIDDAMDAYELTINEKIKRQEVDIEELKGKNLSCWCKIGEKCHAEILLKIANP